MDDEAKLLQRLLSQDKTAVNEFYQKYSVRLFRFIRRRIGNEQDVEEIAQDTLFAFLEGIRDFTGKCCLNTYLCSIASHKIVDFYRKKRFQKMVFSQMPRGIELFFSQIADPQSTLDQTLIKQKISFVFASLSPKYSRMLRLKYVEGRSVEEIATMLSVSFKAAESVLFRARKAFVKLYVANEGAGLL